jgi:hypothetical protein
VPGTAAGRSQRLPGDAPSSFVQPACDATVLEPRGMSGEEEEGRLRNIVGGGYVAHDAAADGMDHGPVAGNDFGEGGFTSFCGEGGQKFVIGRPYDRGEHSGGLHAVLWPAERQ